MTDFLAAFFFIVFAGCALTVLVLIKSGALDPPVPKKFARQTFTVPSVDGATLTADIVVDETYLLKAEEIVNRFGASRTQRSLLPGNLDQSDNLFRHLQYYGKMTGHTVISARLNLPPEKPKKPTLAEHLTDNLKAKREAARGIIDLVQLTPDDLDGKSLEKHEKEYGASQVSRLFHDDDRA